MPSSRFAPSVALVLAVALSAACSAKPKPAAAPDAAKAAEQAPTLIPVPPENPVPPPPAAASVETLPSSLDELNRKGYLKDAFFDFDQYQLTSADRDALEKDAEWLRKWKAIQVTLEGHCDERGTAAYNMALGEKRAEAARDYLVSLGIPAERIRVISYGKEKPLVDGHDETAWSQNRRDHFVIAAR